MCVFYRERKKESECVSFCVWVRYFVCVCVCVCVCVLERECVRDVREREKKECVSMCSRFLHRTA